MLYNKLIKLINSYISKVSLACEFSQPDIIDELIERLKQLDYLLEKVRMSEREHTIYCAIENDFSEEGVGFRQLPEEVLYKLSKLPVYECKKQSRSEMLLFTETFYYFAWRVCHIMQDKNKFLPNLKMFKTPIGIRTVRNNLIEHSDSKDSLILSRSWAYGGPEGPIVKGYRPDGKFNDSGLYINAQELYDCLYDVFKVYKEDNA